MAHKIVPTGYFPSHKKAAYVEIEGDDKLSTLRPPINDDVQTAVLMTLVGRGIIDFSTSIEYFGRSDFFHIVSWRSRVLKIRLIGMG